MMAGHLLRKGRGSKESRAVIGDDGPAPRRGGYGYWWLAVGLTVAGLALVIGARQLGTAFDGATVVTFGEKADLGYGAGLTCSAPVEMQRSRLTWEPPETGYIVSTTCTITAGDDMIDAYMMVNTLITSDGVQNDQVIDPGLNGPRFVPAHRSITWEMAYGINDRRDLTLIVFLASPRYDTVTFTSETGL